MAFKLLIMRVWRSSKIHTEDTDNVSTDAFESAYFSLQFLSEKYDNRGEWGRSRRGEKPLIGALVSDLKTGATLL